MAADAYLKVAASQLQQAASALKQDASSIRGEAISFRQQTEHEISSLESQIRIRRSEAEHAANDEPNKAATHMAEVQRMSKELESKRQELAKSIAEHEQAAKTKEAKIEQLAAQASNMERMANDPTLR